MSKSHQPESSIVASPNPSEVRTAARRSRLRAWSIRLSAWFRWLHIYVSMIGLAAVLFFSVTGLTLNHQDWVFGQVERSQRDEGRVDPAWLAPAGDSQSVDQLRVVEQLRARHGVRGALAEFRVDEPECSVSFKGPGYSADAFIDRETGKYQLVQVRQGLVAVLNDLHKGRDTGPVWSWAIDVSAVVLAIISVTGLILIFTLRLRRTTGLIVAAAGTLALVVLVLYGVP